MDLLILSERTFIAEALAELLGSDDRVDDVVIASNAADLERAISNDRACRLLIDLDRPLLSPDQFVDLLRHASGQRRMGFYDVFNPGHAHLAFDLGITVLVPLTSTVDDLCAKILEDHQNSSATLAAGIDRFALLKLGSLTAREIEVLTLLTRGMQVSEIAQALSITHHTVQTHKRRIYAKLGVQSQAQAVRLASSAGLTPLN